MRCFLSTAVVAIAFGVAAQVASAQNIKSANRIEEDWVLVVDESASPDGPQVNTVMGPTADLSMPVVALDINYRHDPIYAAGGLQVLVYGSNGLLSSKTTATSPLNLANETVSWTQRLSISDGSVQYSIPKVSSTTWGSSTDDSLVLGAFPATLTAFEDYDPAASVANSGGAWKTGGLKSLTLAQVRYYDGETLLGTDTTPRVVDCTRPFTRP